MILSTIELRNLKKYYGKVLASSIDHLYVKDGELLTLLGPSGCGKTTTLRLISGLTTPDEGKIFLDGIDVTNLPPEKRNLTMVFQNFALFPHMNVFENVAFGLRMKHMSEKEIKNRVNEMLRMFRLELLADRRIDQISGGQQQRVGVARAIAPHPSVVLFDEPLSNLDAKLREEVRYELQELQKKVKITSIYVTHDQSEAMVLSDRIAVMQNGFINQIGTPKDIYSNPINAFVASFVGMANFIKGKVEKQVSEDKYIFRTDDGFGIIARKSFTGSEPGILVIRPQAITLAINDVEGEIITGTIISKMYLGENIEYKIMFGKNVIRTFLPSTNEVGEINGKIKMVIKDAVIVKE